jgi:hypothetical protein
MYLPAGFRNQAVRKPELDVTHSDRLKKLFWAFGPATPDRGTHLRQ